MENSAEKEITSQKLKEKLAEWKAVAPTRFAAIQDNLLFTLRKTYFKCAYECYGGRSMEQREGINDCIKLCRVPFGDVKREIDNEKAMHEENLRRSMMVCKDKYKAAKLKKKTEATIDVVSCAEQAFKDSIKKLPIHANKLKASLGIKDNSSF